tara:strand:+ start:797 stop:1921 length:1125 start_codon:yes stop_codon:yes gene_type:complete
MENFKLLQIVPSLISGGVERGTIDLSNYLSEKNIKNYIASSGGILLNQLNNKNSYHIKLSLDSKNFLKYFFLAKQLEDKIINNGINIVHLRSRAPAWLLPFINKSNIKTVSTFHNIYGNQNKIKYFYNKQLGNVNSIVAISEYVKREIIKQYSLQEQKISVINRGCDTSFFNPKKIESNQIQKFISKFKIPLNKKIILFPGRYTEWKGQVDFLDIVNYFIEKDYIFVFVGDSKNTSYKNKFIKIIKKKNLENVCLVLDNMSSYELRNMYYISKIIISAPLKPEGFGRVISESLSMKKIILAYNYGGAKDQLIKLDDIYKIQPNNKKELMKKIEMFIDIDNQEHENLAEESRSHIVKFFSNEIMLNKYFELYLNL